MADKHLYDLIIVGAGPAGLSAGLYAGRATLDTLILEGDTVGGQVTTTSVVYNYPAVEKVDGTQLMNQMQKQVTDFGVTIAHDQVEKYQLADEVKLLVGKSGQEYRARSVIIATGAQPRTVGFSGEDEFRGRGVAYCSTCDGELFWVCRFLSSVVAMLRRKKLTTSAGSANTSRYWFEEIILAVHR